MNIRFVFVSKDEKFMMPNEYTDNIKRENDELRFDYVRNNSTSLASLYNVMLSEDNSKYDYVVLMHADVKLDINSFVDHLESVGGKYDVIGLCGCSKISVGRSPLNWFCGSIPFPNDRYGCVTHSEMGNQTSFFNAHHPDITDHEVACIDGLCIILSRHAIDAGLRFDEDLTGFNCYDTQISFDSVIKFGLKLGVIVRKDLVHMSVGKSILTDEFFKDEKVLRKRYGFEIPKGSRLETLISSGKI